MKTICLVGGKLQGFEAAYLSKKAGMNVIVVDKNFQALIRNYADEFHCFDVTKEPEKKPPGQLRCRHGAKLYSPVRMGKKGDRSLTFVYFRN